MLFPIDIHIYGALAASLLAVQPGMMTQFGKVIGFSHGFGVSENCRICHREDSPLLLYLLMHAGTLYPSTLLLDDPDFDLVLITRLLPNSQNLISP